MPSNFSLDLTCHISCQRTKSRYTYVHPHPYKATTPAPPNHCDFHNQTNKSRSAAGKGLLSAKQMETVYSFPRYPSKRQSTHQELRLGAQWPRGLCSGLLLQINSHALGPALLQMRMSCYSRYINSRRHQLQQPRDRQGWGLVTQGHMKVRLKQNYLNRGHVVTRQMQTHSCKFRKVLHLIF